MGRRLYMEVRKRSAKPLNGSQKARALLAVCAHNSYILTSVPRDERCSIAGIVMPNRQNLLPLGARMSGEITGVAAYCKTKRGYQWLW